jgi:hypothetical protein
MTRGRILLATFAVVAAAAVAGNAQAQQRAQRLPASMALDNQRAATLTGLELADSEGTVIGRLARPLAAGKKATMRLSRGKGCEIAVRGQFDDEGEVEEIVNLCREKVLRFRD